MPFVFAGTKPEYVYLTEEQWTPYLLHRHKHCRADTLVHKTPTPAAWPFHQNPPAYEKSPPYIPMVSPPDNHDEAAQVLDRGIVPASAFCENWQRMFLSSNAQTAPCCNHESVQSGSADRSVMGSGTNVQLLVVQKRILVIDSSGLPDLTCLCFFQAATFPAARLTDYRNT